ncbi:hypothetical protein QBC35DRAFT_485593 [Podospora australis]|uniref:Subtelomeric hrmA-associated cluster protein AFUB-079030/YDR124W-like helical bundle domain-containing protein n=1 Tax=Podospora australis TaxID=1536484 RepID=A0AAN7ANR7_9PEZI|nr:hypothetical protein QBC35DRAFT_485593 [Podospora australis]
MSQTVSRALVENCAINHTNFFLAVTLRNGQHAYFSGPRTLSDLEVRDMFNMRAFQEYQGLPAIRSELDTYSNSPRRLRRRRRQQTGSRSHPRRQRGTANEDDSDDEPAPISTVRTPLQIGDSDAVWNFYKRSFEAVQQLACKIIAKAFIKTIAPRKQTKHPYTSGEVKKPDWWPRDRTEKGRHVEHKEPDHTSKDQRVHLLCHLLRLVVEPNARQHPDLRPLGITVSTLERAAMDQLFSFWENPKNEAKRPFLAEIFKVAKHEARFKRDECDANTTIYVTAQGPRGEPSPSDDEEDDHMEDNEEMTRDESAPPLTTPSSQTSTQTYHAQTSGSSHQLGNDTTDLANAMDGVTLSNPQYTSPPMIQADLPPGQNELVHIHIRENSLPSMHDTSRRSSMYGSPTEFSAPPAAHHQGMYPTNGGWQQAATTAPGSPGMYAFPPMHQQHQPPPLPPPPHPSTTFNPQSSMPLAHHHHHHQPQGYLTAQANDGLPRPPLVVYPGNNGGGVVSSPVVSHGGQHHHHHQHHQQQQQGYSGYLQHHHMTSAGNGRYSTGHGMDPRPPLP